jgi:amidase
MPTATTDLHNLELTELAERIWTGEISPLAVTRAQLERIASLDGGLSSYA